MVVVRSHSVPCYPVHLLPLIIVAANVSSQLNLKEGREKVESKKQKKKLKNDMG